MYDMINSTTRLGDLKNFTEKLPQREGKHTT